MESPTMPCISPSPNHRARSPSDPRSSLEDKTIDVAKVEEIHRATTLGNLRSVQQLIDRKRLAFCRDQMGASPLHKAVIYGQKEIIEYLIERFPSAIHAKDNRGRTPLHYAAVLPESVDIYRLLVEGGADEKATDMFNKKPEDYLTHREGISAQVLRESAIVSRPLGQRRSRKSASRIIDPQSWSKIHSSRSLMHRSNLRELIRQGNISTLEEIVIQGYGDRLVGEEGSAPMVKEFLRRVPCLIEQINQLHKAAQRGSLNDLKSLLDQKKLVFARDQIGCTPLHKSVMYGQLEVASYLSSTYPATLDARDHDGRTALHYAAALEDDRVMYNMLIKNGASNLLPDYKGHTAEYYLRFGDQINIQQLIKRSQRLNANYFINTANRIKSRSPSRRRGASPDDHRPTKFHGDILSSDHDTTEADDRSSNSSSGDPSSRLLSKPNLRSKPGNTLAHASPKPILREQITSANLKKWIQEQDLSSLECAILEGHGDRVKSKVETLVKEKEAEKLQIYVEETLPKILEKIRTIHAAVSCGDLRGLKANLDKNDYALVKDHLGMAPLHKAVILGHLDVVEFILECFPETVNARDHEGRTALHYAAATTHKNGQKIYKILLRSGADTKIRDMSGKTADYYRVHLLPLPLELSRLATKRKVQDPSGLSPTMPHRRIVLPCIKEKLATALNEGDSNGLQELTLEGYGDLLIGRTCWGEEARKFLKNLPSLMDSIKTLHASISHGELDNVVQLVQNDSNLLHAKDDNGLMAIHLAVSKDHTQIVDYILQNFKSQVHLKDGFGRTSLHIAAQNKNLDMFKKLLEAGANPMSIDQRGRTAEYYLKLHSGADAKTTTVGAEAKPENSKQSSKIEAAKEDSTQEIVAQTSQGHAESRQDGDEFAASKKAKSSDEKQTDAEAKPHQILNMERDQTSGESKITDQSSSIDKPEASHVVRLEEPGDTLNQSRASENFGLEDEDKKVVEKRRGFGTKRQSSMDKSKSNHGKSDPRKAEKSNSQAQNEQKTSEVVFEPKKVTTNDKRKNEETNEQVEIESKDSSETAKEVNMSKEKLKNEETNEQVEIGSKDSSETAKEVNKSKDKLKNEETKEQETIKSKEGSKNGRQVQKLKVLEAKDQLKSEETKEQSEIISKEGSEIGKSKEVEAIDERGNEETNIQVEIEDKEGSETGLEVEKPKVVATKDEPKSEETNEQVKMKSKDAKQVEKLKREGSKDEVKNEESNEQVKVKSKEGSKNGKQVQKAAKQSHVKKEKSKETESRTSNETEKSNSEAVHCNSLELESNKSTDLISDHKMEAFNKAIEEKSLGGFDKQSDGPYKSEEQLKDSKEGSEDGERKITEATETAETTESKDDNEQEMDSCKSTRKGSHVEVNTENRETRSDRRDEKQVGEESGNSAESGQGPDEKPCSGDERKNGAEEEEEEDRIAEKKMDKPSTTRSSEAKLVGQKSNSIEGKKMVRKQSLVTTKKETTSEMKRATRQQSLPSINSSVKSVKSEVKKGTKESCESVYGHSPCTKEKADTPKTKAIKQKAEELAETLVNDSSKIAAIKLDQKDPSYAGKSDETKNVERNSKKNGSVKKAVHQSVAKIKREQRIDTTSSKESNEIEAYIEQREAVEDKRNHDEDLLAVIDPKSLKEQIKRREAKKVKQEAPVDQNNGPEDQVSVDEKKKGDLEATENAEASPEKGRSSQSTALSEDRLNELIEKWLNEGDLLRLEHVVIAGQGERLVGRKSAQQPVQEFLNLVPAYMEKMKKVHETVVRGNLSQVRQILTRKRFALSRDHAGASPLHLAVLHGHLDVVEYIVSQFPETLDGPDNEGRTPLHYAAIMASKDRQFYDLLKAAGSSTNLVDKLGNAPDHYLNHPGEMSFADLLSNYPKFSETEGKSVDVWQRPPTADIESRLTPSPSDSQPDDENGAVTQINADVHIDGKTCDLEDGSEKQDEQVNKEVETISVQFRESLKEEKGRLQEDIRKIMGSVPNDPAVEPLTSCNEESDGGQKSGDTTISEYELCQVKDEHGRTVLHLVAGKPQKKAILYRMLYSAEYLIPERDEKYRTIRDIAIDSGLKENVQVIDSYILNAFVRRNVGFAQRLSHEGYDLLNVVDESGNDITSVLRRNNITSMVNLLQDIVYFQKSREELHTFVKNGYSQGVSELVDADSTLVTAKNCRGRTALHVAILFGNLDIISTLINANFGVVNSQDNMGRTPLHYAMATSKVEQIGKMLIRAGANRQIRDVKMRTPSYYFVYNADIRQIKAEERSLHT